jgi:hypothetical protein
MRALRSASQVLPGFFRTKQSLRVAPPVRKRIGPKPVRPQTARNRRAPVNLTRLITATVQTLLADHIQQRRRRMNPLQQGSLKLAGVHPTRRAVRVPLNKRSPVLPASRKLILQSGSNLPSRHRLLPHLGECSVAPPTPAQTFWRKYKIFSGGGPSGGPESRAVEVHGLSDPESARAHLGPGARAAPDES